jgi:hypothetical protein
MKEQLLKLIYQNYQSKSYQIEKKERNIMIEEFYKKRLYWKWKINRRKFRRY